MRLFSLFLFISIISCSIAQTDILVTDFQNGIPPAYSIINNDGSNPDVSVSEYTSAWITLTDTVNSSDVVASATSYFSPIGKADRWLITPPLTLGEYGNFIEWQARSQDASYPDDYLVLISTTDNHLTSFNDTIGYIIEENAEWVTRTADLSESGFNGQTVYIAFRLVTNDGFKLYLDDIHIWKNDPAAIDEWSSSLITLYPNPTQDYINVPSDIKIEEGSVYSLGGTLLISSKENSINVSELSSGIYLLKIKSVEGIHSLRFVKN
jgi:hypothetical protein